MHDIGIKTALVNINNIRIPKIKKYLTHDGYFTTAINHHMVDNAAKSKFNMRSFPATLLAFIHDSFPKNVHVL